MMVDWWRHIAPRTPVTVGRTPLGPGLDVVEYPKIARLKVARIQCRLCGGGLGDGEMVVWFERESGWRSDLAHAECAVFVEQPNGTIARPSGAPAKLQDAVAGTLLLTTDEWNAWAPADRYVSEQEATIRGHRRPKTP